MNIDLFLSKKWTKPQKAILAVLLVVLVSLSLYMVWAWRFGFDHVFAWDTVTELKEKVFQLPPVFFESFSFTATAPLWYVSESYRPALLMVNKQAYLIMLISVLSGLSLILSALSRLKGFWFLIGALLLGLVIASFRLESNFLVHTKWPFLIVFGVSGLTYYLTQYYAPRLSVVKSWLIWLIVWTLIIISIDKFSLINEPLLSVSAYGLIAALLISAVFIFLISHEILSALYRIVSDNSQEGKSSLVPWLIVTFVVLFNAVLVYLENSRRLDFSSYVFAPVILYLLSLAFGFSGFKNISGQREWFTWEGVGVWVYLGMAIITTGTIGLVYGSANDPLIELVEDYISISFMAMSFVFMIYVAGNYIQPILKGLPFHKIIYKGPHFRLLLARIGAVFLILVIFSFKKKFSYFQLQSGLNNAIADFYLEEGDLTTAEVYYKNGANFDFYNHRSNLALASIASAANDKINMVYFYHQAGKRSPNEQAVIGESRALEEQDMFFEAVFSLKRGLEEFPKSHKIYTNLARLQNKAGVSDSTLINLDKAIQFCKNCETENANFLAFWIENGREDKLEEMRAMTGKAKGYNFKANESAIRQILGESIEFDEFVVKKDSSLDMSRAAYLFNAITGPNTVNNTEINAKSLQTFQEKQVNDVLFEQLSWAYANQNYYRENKLEGIKLLNGLAQSSSPLAALYSQNLGLWYIREGALSQAIEYLSMSGDETSAEALNDQNLKNKLAEQQRVQAESLTTELTVENYSEILNKAPLNPYLLIKVSDFLAGQDKLSDAYNVVFYGMDYIKNDPNLIKSYIERSIDISMFDYAEDGLSQLKGLVSPAEIDEITEVIKATKQKSSSF